MAGQKRLEVIIGGDNKGAKKAMDDTAGDAGGLASRLGSALGGGALAVGAAAVAAVGGISITLLGAYNAAAESQKVTRETERVIRTTGGAANVSAEQVADLGKSLSSTTGISGKLIRSTENLLLTFTKVRNEVGAGNDVFTQATGLALDMSVVLGTDASAAAIQLGKALNDPIKGITALSRAGVSFTAQQKEQIKTLMASGDQLGAQKVILKELATEFGGAAETAATPLMKLQTQVAAIATRIGTYLVPAVDAAATWLGARLPGALDAASRGADSFLAAAAPIARDVFDKMAQAGEAIGARLGPALENVGRTIAALAAYAAPAAAAIAAIAGGAVLAGLVALAEVLQRVTGFIANHIELVKLLATVGFVYLTAQIVATTAAYIELAGVWAAIQWLTFRDMLIRVAEALAVAGASGAGFIETLGLMRGAMLGLEASAGPIGLALAGLGLIIYGFATAGDEGKKSADAFIKSLDVNPSDLNSVNAAIKELSTNIDELGQRGSTIADRFGGLADVVIPFHDVANSSEDARGKMDELKKKLDELQPSATAAENKFNEMAATMAAQQGPAAQTTEGLRSIHDHLVALAAAGKVDITQPGAVERLNELRDSASFTTPTMQGLAGAFNAVAAETSTAEDQVKAYKTALDELIGVHISSIQTENSFGAALDVVTQKVAGGVNITDAYNAKSREASGAVLAAADSAIKHSVSLLQEGQGLDVASNALSAHREHLITTMQTTGMSRAAAEAYINTLGLTPENILTVAHMSKEDAQAGAVALQGHYANIDRFIVTTAQLNIAGAIANANTLQAKLAEVAHQSDIARSGYALGLTLAGRANGGITLHQYASGGRESHVAQFARGGAMRLWAEPETGGEAYIPLGSSKRGQSTKILAQVAEMFGYGLTRPGGASAVGRGAGRAGSSGGTVHIHLHGVAALVDEEGMGRLVNRGLRAAQRQGVSMAWSSE